MYTKINRLHYLSYNVIIIGFFSVTRTPHDHHHLPPPSLLPLYFQILQS